jgi:flagellin
MSVTRVYTNPEALIANRNLGVVERDLNTTLRRLSSGLRINKSSDDPSGVGLAARLESQWRGTTMATQNVQDALGLMGVADETVGGIMDLLLKARDLAVRAANDATMDDTSRNLLNNEFQAILDTIDDIAGAAIFNGKGVLDGTIDGAVVQAGPDNLAAMQIALSVDAMSQGGLGGPNNVNLDGNTISTQAGALATIASVQSAINDVAGVATAMGMQVQKFESILDELTTAEVNLAASTSRIKDADMALEISNLARQQIIMQAGVAALAQANMQPQAIMTLLGTA